jgi:hypothetical protein
MGSDLLDRGEVRHDGGDASGLAAGKGGPADSIPCRILGQQEGVIANSVPKLEGASASVPEPLIRRATSLSAGRESLASQHLPVCALQAR